jgi:anti-anti-sigma factor
MNTPIEIKHTQIQGVEVFEFHGELDETNADKTFTAIYNAVGDFTGKKILFNLIGLKYLNSKSIGYIADIFSHIEDGNGQMQLSNLGEEAKDTLELVGITTIIAVSATQEEALQKFN